MTSQANLDKFNEFYKETYSNILRYIIIKCHNINDVNDIIQDKNYISDFDKLVKETEQLEK